MKRLVLATLVAAAALCAKADEGMWMLNKLDAATQQTLARLGLKLSAQQLYDPQSGTSLKDAVVDFGDFCSGVVVSPDGLVFTNHHCGFGAIQALSTTEDDILKNGFVAHSFAEERPADGLYVYFLQHTDDITQVVNAKLDSIRQASPAITDVALQTARAEEVLDELQTKYAAQNPDLEVRVQSYYHGNAYYVSYYKVYKDVRLVFTPTQTLGKFGGDTDNWMWPRQTSDFSVFRIYADADGNPAEYSEDNVPLHPKRWAQVSLDGFQAGDYCMTIGYPGSTDRYLSSYGIEERMEMQNEPRIEVRGLKQEVWKKWMHQERAIGIKYASKFASSSNYWKNSIGMNKALTDLNVIPEKRQLEEQVVQWAQQDAGRQARFVGMMDSLRCGYDRQKRDMRALMYYNETFRGIELTTLARRAQTLALATDSAEAAEAMQDLQEFLKDYDARVDEETMAVLLRNYAEKVDSAYHPNYFHTIRDEFHGDYAAYAHDVFSRTAFTKPNAMELLCLMGKEVNSDPAMQFLLDNREAQYAFMGLFDQRPQTEYYEHLLTQALLEMDQETPHYSDANFSMRLSYGIIQDYTAGGTHYDYFTTAQSLLDKAAQQQEIEDYTLEDDIVELLKRGDFGRYADSRTGQMQLCFLSNNDITGGNSGSPMFNGEGKLIGLAFDGNWEAMSGDILFNADLQRCIGVDIRYVLFLIDKWGHADNLIKEILQ